MKPRIALFGGTFDPVHNAHLEIARAALGRLGLQQVLFTPAANPPHKSDRAQAPYADRVGMLELACSGNPGFAVSRIEQPSASEPVQHSYSILTIRKLLASGTGPLAFLIGADAFAEIRTWHQWQEVVELVEFIVVDRPGAAYQTPEGAVVHVLSGLRMPESSSTVRLMIAQSQGGAMDTAIPVPAAVLRYIREHGLYRSRDEQIPPNLG